MIVIGIDPGTNTGFAVRDIAARRFLRVASFSILEAMQQVLIWRDACAGSSGLPDLALVIFEDARMHRIVGGAHATRPEVLQGVGSVKRDCAIWEEFLTRHQIPFEGRRPSNTKVKAEEFERLTGWDQATNNHARDAAMILEPLNVPIVNAKLLALADGARTDKPSAKRPTTGRSRPRHYPRRRNLTL